MRNVVVVLLCLAAGPVAAQQSFSAGRIARLVEQPAIADIAGPLTHALSDSSPRVRTVAARVLAVRDVRGASGAIAEQLGHETNIAAAREEIRALALLNGKDQLATMLAAARRFDGRLDADLAIALGRGAGAEAVDLYTPSLAHLALSPDDRVAFFRYALWGFPRVIAPVAARMVAANDSAAWQSILRVGSEANQEIAGGVLLAGLQHTDPSIRIYTALYLASRPDGSLGAYGAQLQMILAQPQAADSAPRGADEAIAFELLRRSLGQAAKGDLPWQARSDRFASGLTGVERLLSRNERKLLELEASSRSASAPPGEDLSAMPPAVLTNVPAGVASELISADHCDGTWLGTASFSIDRGGRLSKVSLADVRTSRACAETLTTLLKLSLAEPRTMRTKIGDGTAILAHGGRARICFDEAPVRTTIGQPIGPVAPGGTVKAPKAVRRVTPNAGLEGKLRASGGLVIVRMVISVAGCPRDFQVILGDDPVLTTATVVAASQWQFEPAAWNGKPVETIFYLTTDLKKP